MITVEGVTQRTFICALRDLKFALQTCKITTAVHIMREVTKLSVSSRILDRFYLPSAKLDFGVSTFPFWECLIAA